MVTDALDQLNALRNRVAQLTRQQAKAAADLDNANQRITEHTALMREEFDCETVEAARDKLASMEMELSEMITAIENQLGAAS